LKKITFLLVLFVLLFALPVTIKRKVVWAQSDFAVTILADGSLDPPTARLNRTANTYILLDNITTDVGGILIEKDNVIVDGNGYSIERSGTGTGVFLSGIYLPNKNNVTVKDFDLRNFAMGIFLGISSNNSIFKNNITENGDGILLQSLANYNSISENSITYNGAGITLDSSCGNNSISFNEMIGNSQHGVGLFQCNNNTVANNSIRASLYAVRMDYSNDNTIVGNDLEFCNNAIWLYSARGNSVEGNILANNGDGASLAASTSNTFIENYFVSNTLQVNSFNSTNEWDNGSRGNYWSDYVQRYPNATQNGIVWSIPYSIDVNNIDKFPLVNPVMVPEFATSGIVLTSMLGAISAIIIGKNKRALSE